MMDLFDVEAVEAAEASIDAFINKRSKDKEKANEEEVILEDVLEGEGGER
jgi:hypothetical protein